MSRLLPPPPSRFRASASPVVVRRRGVSRCWRMPGWPLLLALASLACPGKLRCTTYAEQTLQRWHTLCDDGTHAVSRYNRVPDCWETTMTSSRRTSCTVCMHPQTRQVELHSPEGRCHHIGEVTCMSLL
jgi:hypothetical protein